MRIEIVRKLTPLHIDPLLDRYQPGLQYEVGNSMGQLFITEGWARVVIEEPRLIVPSGDMEHGIDAHSPPPHHRDGAWPSVEDAIAADTALDCAIAEAIERQTRPARIGVRPPIIRSELSATSSRSPKASGADSAAAVNEPAIACPVPASARKAQLHTRRGLSAT
jgi:hypothetical protein